MSAAARGYSPFLNTFTTYCPHIQNSKMRTAQFFILSECCLQSKNTASMAAFVAKKNATESGERSIIDMCKMIYYSSLLGLQGVLKAGLRHKRW